MVPNHFLLLMLIGSGLSTHNIYELFHFMAYRRKRAYRRYFRSKRKGVSWTKETIQLMSGFSSTATAD